jgi:archaetidylinositol phosphate synthase
METKRGAALPTTVPSPYVGRDRVGGRENNGGFDEARRELRGLTAAVEKKVLWWLAARTPAWITPDHLTGLGLLGMLLGGLAYWASADRPVWLHVVNVGLVMNWLGDSLDGTLARYRRRCRPRYGFYVDHLVDAFGALFLIGGLALSGHMSAGIAAALLIAYFLVSIDIYLATYALGVFKISFGPFGGTELRLVMMLANLALAAHPRLTLLGRPVALFDVMGAAAIAALALVLAVSTARNVRALYELERL